jgi:hypothetical protein
MTGNKRRQYQGYMLAFLGITYLLHNSVFAKHMLKVVQHATASALTNQEATASFLLLPD